MARITDPFLRLLPPIEQIDLDNDEVMAMLTAEAADDLKFKYPKVYGEPDPPTTPLPDTFTRSERLEVYVRRTDRSLHWHHIKDPRRPGEIDVGDRIEDFLEELGRARGRRAARLVH